MADVLKDPKPTEAASAPFGDYGWVVIVLAVATVLLVAALCFTCGRYHSVKRQLAEAKSQEFKPICDVDEPPPRYVTAATPING